MHSPTVGSGELEAKLLELEQRHAVVLARMAELQHATARLAEALTPSEVADTLLDVASRVLGAIAGVVYFTREHESVGHLQASRGLELREELATIDVSTPLPLARAMRDRTPLWFETYEQLLAEYPHLEGAALGSSCLQAVVALPLLRAGRLLGGFALSFDQERGFDEEDKAWLSSLAQQAALAAERAELYGAERSARSESQILVRLVEALNREQLDLPGLVDRITADATALVEADFGAFFRNVVSEEGEAYLLYTLSGAPKAAFEKLGLPRNTPIFAATFAGEDVVRLADVRKDPRYGTMGPHYGMPKGHLPVVSYLAAPVVSSDGSVLGGLFFGHKEAGRFTEQHERLLRSYAKNAALAIDNAQALLLAKRAEQGQLEAIERMRQALRFNELLMGILAHDLRNPLSAVLSAATLAATQAAAHGDEKLSRMLGRIRSSGERMARLVNQLLDLSRIRLGSGISVTATPHDMSALVQSVVEELEAAHPGLKIALEKSGDSWGEWDGDRLLQVLSNLLGNAAQHGSREAPIRVRIDGRAAESVVVTVSNAGVIPAETLATLFRSVDEARPLRENSSGLGLGLFISQRIVEAHGGTIEVDSREGAGTTFRVRLPRRALERAAESAPADAIGSPPFDLGSSAEPEWGLGSASERAKKFQLLVDSVKDYAIFMLDTHGRVSTWNQGAERIKGYAAREIIGHHFSRFYTQPDIDAGTCEEALQTAEREGRWEAEAWRVRKDGSKFWASIVLTALRDDKGKLVGFAKVTRDLTERRALEQARLRRAEAEAALKLREEFLSLVSHELRTPLAVLTLQLDRLSDAARSDALLARSVARAKKSGEQLNHLVESIFEASAIASGELVLEREDLDLSALVTSAVEELRPAAAGQRVELIAEVQTALRACCDPRRIREAARHLLKNALIYGADGAVVVSLRREADQAVLEILDHGPGIPEADLTRIFERFARASSPKHYAGIGLGLYIVRELVVAHGGSVDARTPEGGGACFTVRLPLSAASARASTKG